jgi:hypothetical protein
MTPMQSLGVCRALTALPLGSARHVNCQAGKDERAGPLDQPCSFLLTGALAGKAQCLECYQGGLRARVAEVFASDSDELTYKPF